MDQLISPVFVPGNLPHNAGELCELYRLADTCVFPVSGFTIFSDSDGCQQVFDLDREKDPDTCYATALLLFSWMVKAEHHEFAVSDDMRADIDPYYGAIRMLDAGERDAYRALLGGNVRVSLVLNPGYEECLVTSRPVREVIQCAWERRDSLDPTGWNSFLNRAIDMLFADIDAGKILMTETDADGWPSMDWCDRALDLQQRLTSEPVPA